MGRCQPLRLYAEMQRRWRTTRFDMSVTASKLTELAAAAAGVAEAEPAAVEYPEGQWIAQSVAHGDAVGLAKAALGQRFWERADTLVAMELAVFYRRGDSQAKLQPDVLVAFGVGRGVRRSVYKVWDEGKAPDFVLEVASPSTADNDAQHKAREYVRIGVREYWRLDPEGSMMGVPLEGYRAQGARYQVVESVAGSGGVEYLRSRALGLDLRTVRRDGATVLVFRDPLTGEEFDGALETVERQRRIAEDRASAAEERVRELEQKLRDATLQIRPMGRASQD